MIGTYIIMFAAILTFMIGKAHADKYENVLVEKTDALVQKYFRR